jgi:putative sporulation protein YtaF
MSLMFVVFLGVAVSMDALFAGIAYGLKGIGVPFGPLTITGIVTGTFTALAMLGAHSLGKVVDTHLAMAAGASLLILLGLYHLLNQYLSEGNPDPASGEVVPEHKLTFSIGHLIIVIMARPEVADLDQSKSISSTEAILLGAALGIDNMVATFAASLAGAIPAYTPVAMGVIQMGFIAAGLYTSARLIPEGMKRRLPYLSGAILVLLGILRLL